MRRIKARLEELLRERLVLRNALADVERQAWENAQRAFLAERTRDAAMRMLGSRVHVHGQMNAQTRRYGVTMTADEELFLMVGPDEARLVLDEVMRMVARRLSYARGAPPDFQHPPPPAPQESLTDGDIPARPPF